VSSMPDEPTNQTSHIPTEYLQGIVERVTYHAEDSGYTVARLKVPGERDLITIVGRFPDIHAGQTLRLTGYWREHLKYGRQFQVTHAQETKPATLTGLEKYLGSGLIKGIGPVTARRIVAHFGLETLDIIEHSCSRLIEVTGIGEKRVAMIERAWAAQQAIKEVMLFLRGHNVSTTYAVKIYKEYGDQAINVVSKNPYQLATDIYGIGFVTADTIARNIGIAPDSDFRYRAGMLYVLQQAAEDGHCFLPEQELIERVVKRLALPDSPVDPVRIGELIARMAEEKQLITQPGYGDLAEEILCYAPAFYYTEQALASRLAAFAKSPVVVDLSRGERWTLRSTEKRGITLSEEQLQAVELAASSRLLVLTGGPGCGKTFTTKAMVDLWRAMGKSILLAAPTGRAAQRLSEMTGQEAKTAHRCRPTAMEMYNGPGRKRRNGRIGFSPTASGLILCAIRGGDCCDRIRLIPRDSVDPFDLNALPTRDLNGRSWQRALIRPHLTWWEFRVQLDLGRSHLYPQDVPLIVCLVRTQDDRHPQTILELGQRGLSR
jgi:exodeoxyribonuclease V alpha subunit